ncbi:GreA/GreB family elongation factor [Candidatus Uhrbacteria bacterium]|nr:GreA/GreB family elongation factor [Candidatus Uhrbacteria bacterium]
MPHELAEYTYDIHPLIVSSSMRVPQRRSERDRELRERVDYHLTPDAIERLQRELADLKDRARPKAIAEMQRTSEMGDRSDNAAYTTAKAQLTRINFRILTIEDRLKYAIPIAQGADRFGRVQVGSRVTVQVHGSERSFAIVGSQEVNPGRGRISHHSPLGAALIGRAVGDIVRIEVQGRSTEYCIVRVE